MCGHAGYQAGERSPRVDKHQLVSDWLKKSWEATLENRQLSMKTNGGDDEEDDGDYDDDDDGDNNEDDEEDNDDDNDYYYYYY